MNELQKKEWELLQCVIEICDRLKIKYYLVCGSALGAVKYKGFIPWDDDVDIAMLRPDYEYFLEQAPQYLPDHYFLQNYKTEREFSNIFTKIRNTNTTFIEASASNLTINHGIYIDIFPLDGYPEDKWARRQLEIKKACYKRILSLAYLPNREWKKWIVYPLRHILLRNRVHYFVQKYEKMITSFPVERANILANHGNWQGRLDYTPKEQFGEGVYAMFEGLKVRIPADYDAYLRKKYGDYEKDLPESEKKGHHYYTVCDCNQSYQKYMNGNAQ